MKSTDPIPPQIQIPLHFLVLFLLPIGATAADWPQWRGPDRDGISKEGGLVLEWPEDGPRRLWSTEVGIGSSSMAIAGGRVVTMGNENDVDVVRSLDVRTGEEIWAHRYPCPFERRSFEGGTTTTPTIDGERLYTLSYEGDLFCLSAESGKVLWSKNLPKDFGGKPPRWGYSGSPLVAGDHLIVEAGGEKSSLVALHKETGRTLWKSGSYKAGYSSPILLDQGEEAATAIFSAYGLVVFRLSDGEEQWKHRWKTSYDINAATPIVSGNSILISSGYGTGAAVLQTHQAEPDVLWMSKEFANQFSSSVLVRGHLFGFHGNIGRGGPFRSVEFNSGAVNWSEHGLGVGTVILVDGRLVILSERGELVLAEADAAEFKEIARAQVLGGRCWVSPAYSNGLLYCRNNQGRLICLQLGSPMGKLALN